MELEGKGVANRVGRGLQQAQRQPKGAVHLDHRAAVRRVRSERAVAVGIGDQHHAVTRQGVEGRPHERRGELEGEVLIDERVDGELRAFEPRDRVLHRKEGAPRQPVLRLLPEAFRRRGRVHEVADAL